MKKYLIIGGSGFIGKNILQILPKNIEIIIVTSKKNVIVDLLKDKKFKKVSIKNYNFIDSKNKAIIEKQNVILNCCGGYPRNKDKNQLNYLNNYLPKKLFNLSKNKDITYFLNMNTILINRESLYVKYKHKFSDFLKTQNCKTKVIDLHISHVYGDIRNDKELIYKIIKTILNKTKNLKLTKGDQKRDFLHIKDFINIIKKILKLNFKKNYNKVYVCNYNSYSIKELVFLIKKITSSNINIKFGYYNYKIGEDFNVKYFKKPSYDIYSKSKVDLIKGLRLLFNQMKIKHC